MTLKMLSFLMNVLEIKFIKSVPDWDYEKLGKIKHENLLYLMLILVIYTLL